MAAGDLVVADYQLELRSVLMGAGSDDYIIDRDRGGLTGFIDPVVELVETEYAHEKGSFVGTARTPARTGQAALVVVGTSDTDCGTNLAALRATWAPSSSAVPLYFQIPGFGKSYVMGHPLGFTAQMGNLSSAAVPILASFRITDPTIYT